MNRINTTYAPPGSAYITAENRQLLEPIVLFDAGQVQTNTSFGPTWHARSGVATLTFQFEGDLHHQDGGGNRGVIRQGRFQWMQAGDGWVGIQQLWVQLPPADESGPVRDFDVQPEEVATAGNTRVFVGAYGQMHTNADALARGRARIEELGSDRRAHGVVP